MSGIAFHFQLDPDKPDEARALALLEAWQYSGWNLQKIIVAALLTLAQEQSPPADNNPAVQEMLVTLQAQNDTTLDYLQQIAEQLAALHAQEGALAHTIDQDAPEAVSDNFLASVQKAIKPGIRLDDDDA